MGPFWSRSGQRAWIGTSKGAVFSMVSPPAAAGSGRAGNDLLTDRLRPPARPTRYEIRTAPPGAAGLWSEHEELRPVLLDGARPRSAWGAVDAARRARASLWKPPLRGDPARDPAHLTHHALGAHARAGRRRRDRAARRRRRPRVPIDARRAGARGRRPRAGHVGPAGAPARAPPHRAGRARPRVGHPPPGAAGRPPGAPPPPPDPAHPCARPGGGATSSCGAPPGVAFLPPSP